MRGLNLKTKDCNELVLSARKGDQEAFCVLFDRFKPFIKYYSKKFTNVLIDVDDLSQEGCLGLTSAIRCFKEDSGASFKTYARLCIKRSILSAVRTAGHYVTLSLENVGNIDKRVENPEDLVIMRENILSVKNAIMCGSTPFERKVLLLYINGFSYKSIANKLCVGTKKVDNSLQRVRRRLGLLIQ